MGTRLATPPADAREAAVCAVDPLAARHAAVRERSVELAAPVSAEDAMLQSMPDASPTKWHLAHTTWFFETFVLSQLRGHRPVDETWQVLFNSYYQAVGPQHARPMRGLLSRPSLADVLDYRAHVDASLHDALASGQLDDALRLRVELGLQHEQQHQELMLTDLLHALSCNPLLPAYRDELPAHGAPAGAMRWQRFDEAIVEVGAAAWPHAAREFAFDSESPRHRALVAAFAIATRPVTCGEYLEFVRDGAYRNAALWLSDGWTRVQAAGWQRPLYWLDEEHAFTLGGAREIDADAPVAHLSYYEADAFARWAGARLPTEHEWERAAQGAAVEGNFVESGRLAPTANAGDGVRQLFGDVWEWTSSAFLPYPGYRPWDGAIGEYNGKFMVGQQVLRGGSCASPRGHLRASYRNFFPPHARWQFSGVRLAKDIA
ncbi:ergothioneine biosynthesis protein EgtB [Cognatilysobacter lacus]|uniref:Ergothioneine biosynthesis protein EgtB n=1 Tax=Cognatilysobacter lacus TaxID=1643323 RepID=A0A5D8YZ13_9GAMM|nr:ergothioneine biosynthesis protein EgtB [Lysobacter lacus]TZF87657.1 ergothioneine biosynthesis protein EgtB [Lysobacter lacus]